MKKLFLAFLAFLLLFQLTYAQPGKPDPSFGNNGFVTQYLNGESSDYLYASAKTSDGKIILAGYSIINCYNTFSICRIYSNGKLDEKFGLNGITHVSPGPKDNFAYSMAIQKDGKIVLAGTCSGLGTYSFAIARLNSNGSIDSSFSEDGKLLVSIGGVKDQANNISIQDDGKIIVGGNANVNGKDQYAAIRLLPDGNLDNTFDNDGKVYYDLHPAYTSDCQTSTIQPDGKIILAGGSTYGFDDFSILRLNPDGSKDSSFFGVGHRIMRLWACNNTFYSIKVLQDGRLILLGSGYISGLGPTIGFVKLLPDGNLDPSFGGGKGYINDPESKTIQPNRMLLDDNNRMVTVGEYYNPQTNEFGTAVARYLEDGSLDTDFANNGIYLIRVGISTSTAYDCVIDDDQNLIVSGWATTDQANKGVDFTSIKLQNNGKLDSTFANHGFLFQTMGSYTEYQHFIRSLPNGKILSIGNRIAQFNEDGSLDLDFKINPNIKMANNGYLVQDDGKLLIAGGVIARFKSDGTPDSSFNVIGKFVFPSSSNHYIANSITVQSDGSIVSAGYSKGQYSNDLMVMRLTSDGKLDASFDSDGMAVFDLNLSDDQANSILVQPDGKILVGGYSSISGYRAFCIIRLTSLGALDNSFGNGGKLFYSYDVGYDEITKLILQPDLKILATGYVTKSGKTSSVVLRLNPNGSFDTTFNGNGILILSDFSANSDGDDISLQNDGKILVAAKTISSSGHNLTIYRVKPNGWYDSTFALNGVYVYQNQSVSTINPSIDLQSDHKILISGSQNCQLFMMRLLNDSNPSICMNAITKTYGDQPFNSIVTSNSTGALSYQLISGNSVSIDPSNGTMTIHGAGVSKIKCTQLAANNFSDGIAYAIITIDPAIVNVIADDQQKYLGEENPVFTNTYSGFVYGENESVLTGHPEISTIATKSSNVGSYPITIHQGTLWSDNYEFNFIPGTLTIKLPAGVVDPSTINVSVYPNPTHGKIFIKTNEPVVEVCVTNSLGQKEYFYETEFNTRFEGIIYVMIKTAQGVQVTKVLVN